MNSKILRDLYERHAVAIRRYIALKVPTEDADDVFQELWIAIARSTSPIRHEKSYLYKSAHAKCVDYLRKRARSPLIDLRQEVDITHYSNGASKDMVTAAWDVILLLNHLDDDERTVFLLHELEGFTYNEIANITSLTVDQVRARFYAARRKALDFMKDGK